MNEQEKALYIKKREVLLSTLESLFIYWELAIWIHSLVKSQFINKDTIDWLINIISNAMMSIEDKIAKDKMEKSLQTIKRMKEIEENERINTKINENEILYNIQII